MRFRRLEALQREERQKAHQPGLHQNPIAARTSVRFVRPALAVMSICSGMFDAVRVVPSAPGLELIVDRYWGEEISMSLWHDLWAKVYLHYPFLPSN